MHVYVHVHRPLIQLKIILICHVFNLIMNKYKIPVHVIRIIVKTKTFIFVHDGSKSFYCLFMIINGLNKFERNSEILSAMQTSEQVTADSVKEICSERASSIHC